MLMCQNYEMMNCYINNLDTATVPPAGDQIWGSICAKIMHIHTVYVDRTSDKVFVCVCSTLNCTSVVTKQF